MSQSTKSSLWCVCGRENDQEAWQPCETGLASEEAAVSWLRDNYRDLFAQFDYHEYYIDREDNENPADLYARVPSDGSLRFELANGKPCDV